MFPERSIPYEPPFLGVHQLSAKEKRIFEAEKIRQDFIKSKRLPSLSSSISSPIREAR